jgi:DNA-binding MurR/RpiR family transcriptional regulator
MFHKLMKPDHMYAHILGEMPNLPPQLAVGARYLVDNPDAAVMFSMREIAGKVGVAPATLLRLARTLGFGDWSELRQAYVADFRTSSPLYAERADALVRREGVPGLIQETLRAQSAGVNHAIDANPAGSIDEAAKLLNRAPRIFVAGFMSCRAPALAFAYICRLFRSNVVILGGDGSSLVADLADIRSDDAILTINFRPYASEIHQLAKAVERSRCRLVSIADSRATPLARFAQSILLFGSDSPSFFPSITPAVALVETLAAAMLAHAGDAAAARIGEIEQQLYESGAYDASPRTAI